MPPVETDGSQADHCVGAPDGNVIVVGNLVHPRGQTRRATRDAAAATSAGTARRFFIPMNNGRRADPRRAASRCTSVRPWTSPDGPPTNDHRRSSARSLKPCGGNPATIRPRARSSRAGGRLVEGVVLVLVLVGPTTVTQAVEPPAVRAGRRYTLLNREFFVDEAGTISSRCSSAPTRVTSPSAWSSICRPTSTARQSTNRRIPGRQRPRPPTVWRHACHVAAGCSSSP
jgi:hypothetical protein